MGSETAIRMHCIHVGLEGWALNTHSSTEAKMNKSGLELTTVLFSSG